MVLPVAEMAREFATPLVVMTDDSTLSTVNTSLMTEFQRGENGDKAGEVTIRKT